VVERILWDGLADYCDVASALFEIDGTVAYAPPRMALAERRSKAH
jgi:hypothetical protein